MYRSFISLLKCCENLFIVVLIANLEEKTETMLAASDPQVRYSRNPFSSYLFTLNNFIYFTTVIYTIWEETNRKTRRKQYFTPCSFVLFVISFRRGLWITQCYWIRSRWWDKMCKQESYIFIHPLLLFFWFLWFLLLLPNIFVVFFLIHLFCISSTGYVVTTISSIASILANGRFNL